MANVMTEMPPNDPEILPTKKARTRKALKPRNPSGNEANILAGNPSPSPQVFEDAGKENQDGLRLLLSPNKTKPGSKPKNAKQTFAAELQELQEKLKQMQLEKEKTVELLKERDEMLKRKEEELENRGKEQEKLQLELKKLQKLKEFKPVMSFPLVQSLRETEEKRKGKKKNACLEKKKPSPAYVLWCKDQWNEVKKEKPDADFKEISNILGTKWKNLREDEKRPYQERYQADKESYLQIMGKEKREKEAMKLLEEEQKQKTAMELLEQYLQFKQEKDTENKKRSKKERDPLKPKQPLSAFFLYTNERRAALLAKNKNILEVSKIVGEEWRNLPEDKRAPYEETAKKQKEDYLQQMELYKQKKNEEAAARQNQDEEQMKVQKQEALQLLKKKEKTENVIKKTKEKKRQQKKGRKVDPNKPKKPATSFLLFSKETRKALLQERPGIRNSSLRALISVKWKELAEAEKQIWKDKAAEAVAAYKKELEEYKKTAAAVDGSKQPTS